MHLWRIKIKETGKIWLRAVYKDGRTITYPYYPVWDDIPKQPKLTFSNTFLDLSK